MSTANDARELAAVSQEVHKRIKHAVDKARERMSYGEFCNFHPLYVVCLMQQEQLDAALARIEALEAAARVREGDGK